MAIFKKIAAQGKYQDNQAIPDLITYITRRDKTPSCFIGGVETDENDIAGSMMRVYKIIQIGFHSKVWRVKGFYFFLMFLDIGVLIHAYFQSLVS